MSKKIRILLADDSSVVLRILRQVLQQLPGLDVVASVGTGKHAVLAVAEHQPDVVLMDVEMPEMDGVNAVRAIREMDSQVPVIMFSSTSKKEAEKTIAALVSGANDFESKPSMVGHLGTAMAHIQNRLVPKIVRWARIYRAGARSQTTRHIDSPSCDQLAGGLIEKVRKLPDSPELLVVGGSASGYRSLARFLSQLPAGFALPIIVSAPMHPAFTKQLACQLSTNCELDVREAQPGALLEPGQILITPGNSNVRVQRVGPHLVIDAGTAFDGTEDSDPAGVLLQSVAESTEGQCIGVLLGGTGRQIVEGATQFRRQNGILLAQDESSSEVWEMPGAIVDAGLADAVGSPAALANELMRMVEDTGKRTQPADTLNSTTAEVSK